MRNSVAENSSIGLPTLFETKRWPMPGLRGYLVAILLALVAFVARYCLNPLLGDELPFMFFIAAALVAAWYGGAASGCVVLLFGLVLAEHFFVSAKDRPALSHSVVILHLVRFVFTASLGIGLIEILHRTRHRVEQAKEQLRFYADELERRVAERTASLASTVKSLEGLLYQIAHNLHAPLRAITGYSDILLQENKRSFNESERDYLNRMREASQRMDALIRALLDYGRLSHIELQITDVDLRSVIEQSLYQATYQIKSTDAQIQINITGSLPSVRADEKVLVQVIGHLLENAIKFTSPDSPPRINILAERRAEWVRVSVRDQGIGIPEQYHERIFRPFEQLRPSAAAEGTGIGLAILKEGIDRMGGRVGLESKPGAGSTFWIELPESPEHHFTNSSARARADSTLVKETVTGP